MWCYAHTYPCKYLFKNHYELDKHKVQVEF